MDNKVVTQFTQNSVFKAKIEMDIDSHVMVLDRKQRGLETNCKKSKSVHKVIIKHVFTIAYQEKGFKDIFAVSDKLKADILENNSEINDFVEIARLKLGDEFGR